jgi:hypothetical protein
MHSGADTRTLGRDVTSVSDGHRIDEMLMQVVDVLDDPTPATRVASSCSTSIAFACSSCLNMTWLWQCSPVATLIGVTARRMAA